MQHYTYYDQDESSLYQSREDMVKKLSDESNLSLNETFKLMQEARRSTSTKVSLLTVKEKYTITLRVAICDKSEVS